MSNSSDSASISNSSESGKSQSNSSTTGTGKDNHSESSGSSFSLAREETRAVNRSKLLVLGVISVAAAAIGTATYFFSRNEEIANFHAQFRDYAIEISEITNHEAFNVIAAIDSMGSTFTSYGLEIQGQWPNMTIPHFEITGHKNNILSKAIQLSYSPLIKSEKLAEWEAYSEEHKGWLAESLFERTEYIGSDPHAHRARLAETDPASKMPTEIWRFTNGNSGTPEHQEGPGVDFGPGHYGPIWQQSPAPTDPSIINYDLLSHPVFKRVYHGLWETRMPVLSEILELEWLYGGAVKDDSDHPHSFLLTPVYPDFIHGLHERDDLVGFFTAVLPWDSYFTNLLSNGINGIIVVLHNTCDDHYTYQLNGPEAIYLGSGDLHDHTFDDMEFDNEFASFLQHNFSDTHEHCEYDLRIFPSATLEATFLTSKPAIYTTVVVMVFIFTAATFVLYDYLVQRRQDKVMATAKRTNAIVSSLFPSNVRDRIMKDAQEQVEQEMKANRRLGFGAAPKAQLKTFLDEEQEEAKSYDTKPIADLFPETTVLFADIVGFTAWSSVREPTQVFTLLETVYHSFDEIAKKRRVFKVETVGDCYVAVTGLPDPRPDHAVAMARFARDCLNKMNDLTKKLEVSLGPDTGDLSMRFGLHSGPVTAGVLRGDKSRFQLFGDTVNTAARIESTGQRNKIHLSQETAELLVKSGKSHWVTERQDTVQAKGKGELKTFWLSLRLQSGRSGRSGTTTSSDDVSSNVDTDDAKWVDAGLKTEEDQKPSFDEKTQRLVEWNTDVLARLLKQVIARRQAVETLQKNEPTQTESNQSSGLTPLDEVLEIIHLPEFDAKVARNQANADDIDLGEEVSAQLSDYVTIIAKMYRDNPFHNFEHASHVTMSVVKLLSRIVAPDVECDEDQHAASLHDHTYGITSDPLTQFACVFAALIHDVDHVGVPNAQLVKEGVHIAAVYKNKSVAEQNSVDVAWNLLMDNQFDDLHNTICSSADEHLRFRQLVVNSVMATDIMDKDLKTLRNARWEKAFHEAPEGDSARDAINRKATIVIEHLIQASDVAHTMQHWHIYRKWNERLFHEMYKAYKNGRAEKDPSDFWYKGEIGFFDFYIIPLAKKLKDCGVFGVSSDEYLNYAEKNRKEWELRGEEVVAGMIEKYREDYANHVPDTSPLHTAPIVGFQKAVAEAAAAEASDPLEDSDTEDEEEVDQKPAVMPNMASMEQRVHQYLNRSAQNPAQTSAAEDESEVNKKFLFL